MGIKKDFLWRIYLTFGFILLFGCAILFQAFKIQVIEGDHWRALSDSLTISYHPIKADRGNIYFEDGSLMATLLPFFEVRMDVNTDALTDQIFLKISIRWQYACLTITRINLKKLIKTIW